MSGIVPSRPSGRSTRVRRARLAAALAASLTALAACPSAPAGAAELRPVSQLPAARRQLLADTTARAFDHVRAARAAIVERRSYDARKELAQAATLLEQARGASPATRLGDAIAALQIRYQDPTVEIGVDAYDPIFAAIDDAGDPDAWSATRRHVERARYFRRDGVGASSELVSAVARIPHGEIDAPLAAASADVQVATVELYAGHLEAADRILGRAERSSLAALRLAVGKEDAWLRDVAAPPPPLPSGAPAPPEPTAEATAETESEIPAASEFEEWGEGIGEDPDAPAP